MYYHNRPLKYIEYGKVYPAPEDLIDQDYGKAYKWLSQYCGYFPQIWLSRSSCSYITGFRSSGFGKQKKSDLVLFGFDLIKGFPVKYDPWCRLLTTLMNSKDLADANDCVKGYLESLEEDPPEYDDPFMDTWIKFHDVDKVLNSQLFILQDQVVVPALNLKSAKEIIVENERKKKILRKMGFIEDRIKIQNISR